MCKNILGKKHNFYDLPFRMYCGWFSIVSFDKERMSSFFGPIRFFSPTKEVDCHIIDVHLLTWTWLEYVNLMSVSICLLLTHQLLWIQCSTSWQQNRSWPFCDLIELYLFPTSWCLLSTLDTPPSRRAVEKKAILIAVYSVHCNR